MRTIALAVAGLVVGAVASSALGSGCCAAMSAMPPGLYHDHNNDVEPDYAFDLTGSDVAIESYTRNGKRFVVTYRAMQSR